MAVTIREVRSRADLRRFIRFPHALYRGNSCWVPQLDAGEIALLTPKNPAFEFCDVALWLAELDGTVVGRIAGIINHSYNRKWNARAARFGWIDYVDDEEVSAALLATVESWARGKGMERLHGPLGFTDLDPEGMLVEGFDELATIATIYNHPYYPAHLERLGYSKDADWVEFRIPVPERMPEKMERIVAILRKRLDLRVQMVKRKKEVVPRLPELFHLLNVCYGDLYGFVPLTERQIDTYIKQYFGFIQPDHVCLIFDKQDRLVSFGITMPSLSRAFQRAGGRLFPFGFLHILRGLRERETVDFYLIAVHPDLQNKGVTGLMIGEFWPALYRKGFRFCETNPELETNEDVSGQWKYFEPRQHKRRRCYVKGL